MWKEAIRNIVCGYGCRDVVGKLERLLIALLLVALVVQGSMTSARAMPCADKVTNQHELESILKTYTGMPLLFIQNQGQVDGRVSYYAKMPGQTVYLTSSGLIFDFFYYPKVDQIDSDVWQSERFSFGLDLIGANAKPLIQGGEKDQAVVNYLIGDDPKKWHTDIPTFKEVTYFDTYPGIDFRLYSKESGLEYEFVVKPGAKISDIALAYTGIAGISVDSGELTITTALGNFKQSRPYIYQQIDGTTIEIEGVFKKIGDYSYGFEISSYDASYPLVIDPSLTLAYSTYLGGDQIDSANSIAVEFGYAYITGHTYSSNFPIRNQYQSDQPGCDVFVTKINTNRSGNAGLIYTTYLGGNGDDQAGRIAVESECAYVIGYTDSTNFPIRNQYQSDQPSTDAFVTKINTAGNSILYSTYLGGSGTDFGKDIAVESGCIYSTGSTDSTNFPLRNQYQSDQPSTDAFITVLDTGRSGNDSLIYSTYLGGSSYELGEGIAIESGYIYVTGSTNSTDFPTLNQYQSDQPGKDVFVTKIDATRSGNDCLVYSTYLGGSDEDNGKDIDVESSYAYVTGMAVSADFPTLHEYQSYPPAHPYGNAFVTKIDTDQSGDYSLVYSTYLGGSACDWGCSIATQSGCAYVTGYTDSGNFPIRNEFQPRMLDKDAWVAKIATRQFGDYSLSYSTYLGGPDKDFGYGIAIESGCAYVVGSTLSTNFPTLHQYELDQPNIDAFITKLNAMRNPAGDFNNDGASDIACYSEGTWHIDDNGNGSWSSTGAGNDIQYSFGDAAATPVYGDWNNDNKTEIGTYRNGTWTVDYNGNGIWDRPPRPSLDRHYSFGDASMKPVTGDWNNDGRTEIGTYRNGTWNIDYNGNGNWDGPGAGGDRQYSFGGGSMTPVTGDWNNDGGTEIGTYLNGAWLIDYNGNGVWDAPLGSLEELISNYLNRIDHSFIEEWLINLIKGNNVPFIVGPPEAVFDKQFSFGSTDMLPVTGDWNSDGISEIGVVENNGRWRIDYNSNGLWDDGDMKCSFGNSFGTLIYRLSGTPVGAAAY